MSGLQRLGADAAALTALLTFLGFIWRIPLVQRLLKWINRHRAADAKAALTEVVNEVVSPRFEAIEKTLETFKVDLAQLSPDSGSSVHDRVASIEQTVEAQTEQMTAMSGDIRVLLRKVST